jgi:hypothetical protein
MIPRLYRIHSDHILETGANRIALEYWRKQPTSAIVKSLQPGNIEALMVKLDGRIMNGNTRIKVLEDAWFRGEQPSKRNAAMKKETLP